MTPYMLLFLASYAPAFFVGASMYSLPRWGSLAFLCVLLSPIITSSILSILHVVFLADTAVLYSNRGAEYMELGIWFLAALGLLCGTVLTEVVDTMFALSLMAGQRIALNVSAMCLSAALILFPGFWDGHEPSEACSAVRAFPVRMGGTVAKIPNSPMFGFDLKDGARGTVAYLNTRKLVGEFCKKTEGGTRPAEVVAIQFGINEAVLKANLNSGPCKSEIPQWAQSFCTAVRGQNRLLSNKFSISAQIFNPNNRLKPMMCSDCSAPTFDQISSKAEGTNRTLNFVSTLSKSPDGKPLGIRCHPAFENRQLCFASYRWQDNLQLSFSFVPDSKNIEGTANEVMNLLEAILPAMVTAPTG
jgi:hypothetical protein